MIDDAQKIGDHEFGKASFVKPVFDRHGVAYEIVDTAENTFNKWKALIARFPGGKRSGQIK